MILTDAYEPKYIRTVMSFVDLMDNQSTKEITRVYFDSSYNRFGIVFKDKEPITQPTVILSSVVKPPLPKTPLEHTRLHTPRTQTWEDDEKNVVAVAKSQNEALESYRTTFPESKRSKSSIIAYYYFKHPKGKSTPSPVELISEHLKLGDKVMYAVESEHPHPVGEVIEVSSKKSGNKTVLIQFGINDKVWVDERKYKLVGR